jgi:hypothetical protein
VAPQSGAPVAHLALQQYPVPSTPQIPDAHCWSDVQAVETAWPFSVVPPRQALAADAIASQTRFPRRELTPKASHDVQAL